MATKICLLAVALRIHAISGANVDVESSPESANATSLGDSDDMSLLQINKLSDETSDDAGRETLHRQQSGFQLVEVVKDQRTGVKSLFLDKILQLSETGEGAYHEMIAHMPLQTLRAPPTSVLVIGGGDGGVARRVLQHPSVERVVQVELDPAVVDASRRFFPSLAQAFNDRRMELHIDNAVTWVEKQSTKSPSSFDACIIDSTDDPLVQPWTAEFYAGLQRLLKPSGILAQNVAGPENITALTRMLQLQRKGGFRSVHPALINTIDYESPYVLFLSSGTGHRCMEPAPEAQARGKDLTTDWYSSATHRAALALPPWAHRKWPQLAKANEACAPSVLSVSSKEVPCPDFFKESDASILTTVGGAKEKFLESCTDWHSEVLCNALSNDLFKEQGLDEEPFEPDPEFCDALSELASADEDLKIDEADEESEEDEELSEEDGDDATPPAMLDESVLRKGSRRRSGGKR